MGGGGGGDTGSTLGSTLTPHTTPSTGPAGSPRTGIRGKGRQGAGPGCFPDGTPAAQSPLNLGMDPSDSPSVVPWVGIWVLGRTLLPLPPPPPPLPSVRWGREGEHKEQGVTTNKSTHRCGTIMCMNLSVLLCNC